MTVKIVSEPKTKKGRVFSDAVTRYAGDIVSDMHYIEQCFFRNQTAMEAFHNAKMTKLTGKKVSHSIGYVPEKVTSWVDGVITIIANEDFIKRYKTVEALEGLAEHALSHADDYLQRCIMLPAAEMETVRHINDSFPVKSLTEDDRYELWKATIRMEDEATATKKALTFDPYSTIAEDYEIGDIFYDMFASQLRDSIKDKNAVKQLGDVSRKNFLFALTNFHIGKDAAFLSSANPTVREYRSRHNEEMKAKEKILFSSIASKIPQAKDSFESYLNKAHMLKDEFDALLREMKPETREDFAKLTTTFLGK